ncbi:polyhomeotic-like protein 1 [Megalops cyprinoides]|uniref:polyhomeotic-like protein 1 n=1 Tax=Megalops cyprinoides TaxID=118141 RepID=UPI0018654AE6|nr:polyhomeotic-like protein 1 [Megalops cyprinoides]
MDTEGDQNSGSTNGNTPSGGNSRPPQISQMSLYERQAVQALQALQRQPNAAQYFQQLMLQQQINNAQLHNLAAVQQATLAASRQSSSPSNSVSQATSTAHCTVNLSSSGGGAMTNTRPLGPASSATSSTLSQSVLLGGNTAGQGQMYLRVNRGLRAPLSSQLIFMPGSTATAAVATVAQHQPQQQQQQQEVTPTSSNNQSDSDQVQNLALRCVSSPRVTGVKTECPDRKDTATYSLVQQSQQQQQQFPQTTQQTTTQQQIQPQQQQMHNKMPTYTQPATPTLPTISIKTGNQSNMAPPPAPPLSPSSSPSPSLPLSQLLLSPSGFCQARAVTTVTSAATATHILVPTSNAPSPSQGYPGTSAATKPSINTQTLVVQPLQQSNTNINPEKMGHSSGPVPIQPKTVQGLRLPLQLPPRHPPPILPAPPSNTQSSASHATPHVPVQLVGARQGSLGNSQTLALAQARSCCAQESGALNNSTNSNVVTMVTSMATGGGGAMGGGAGLKSPQTALPLTQISQIHLPTNQSQVLNPNRSSSNTSSSSSPSISSPPTLTVPLPADGQNTASITVTPSGDSVYVQPVQTQGKPVSGSLKRKSESDASSEMVAGSSPLCDQPMRELSPPLSAPAIDTAPGSASPSPPALTLSRAGGGPGERAPPPQAVVKPQVLTHLIEGFVIQEGAEPFPVTGPVKERAEGAFPMAVPPTGQAETEAPTVMKCEYCEGFAPATQFRGSKRFCSMTCAKRYNVSCSHQFRTRRGRAPRGAVGGPGGPDGILRRRGPRRSSSEIACAKIAGRHLPVKCRSESSRSEDVSSCEEEEEEDSLSLSPGSSFSCPRPAHCGPQLDGSGTGGLPLDSGHFLSGSPSHWSVEEVCQFISSLQGCEDLASQFLSQEIDGQALLLLREEHLMSTMNIKLGPALKICASINNLRD